MVVGAGGEKTAAPGQSSPAASPAGPRAHPSWAPIGRHSAGEASWRALAVALGRARRLGAVSFSPARDGEQGEDVGAIVPAASWPPSLGPAYPRGLSSRISRSVVCHRRPSVRLHRARVCRARAAHAGSPNGRATMHGEDPSRQAAMEALPGHTSPKIRRPGGRVRMPTQLAPWGHMESVTGCYSYARQHGAWEQVRARYSLQ